MCSVVSVQAHVFVLARNMWMHCHISVASLDPITPTCCFSHHSSTSGGWERVLGYRRLLLGGVLRCLIPKLQRQTLQKLLKVAQGLLFLARFITWETLKVSTTQMKTQTMILISDESLLCSMSHTSKEYCRSPILRWCWCTVLLTAVYCSQWRDYKQPCFEFIGRLHDAIACSVFV